MSSWMSGTPANPCPRTILAAELSALDRAVWPPVGEIGGRQYEAAILLVRAARELVGNLGEPLHRDAVSLVRVAVACLNAVALDSLEAGDVAAALTLIAKTFVSLADKDPGPQDAGLSHMHATLAELAERGPDAGASPRVSSGSADVMSVDDA